MADKIDEIVKCEHCHRYLPVAVREQHYKDDCLVKLAKQYNNLPKPLGWHGLYVNHNLKVNNTYQE